MPDLDSPSVQPALHVSAIRIRYVKAPMRFALGTSAAAMTAAPLLLVDLETREGVVGHAYFFAIATAAPRLSQRSCRNLRDLSSAFR